MGVCGCLGVSRSSCNNSTSSPLMLFNVHLQRRSDNASSLTTPVALELDLIRHTEDIFVTEIVWRKRTVAPYHEFLVCFVQQHGTETKDVIMIELGAIPQNDSKETQNSKSTSSRRILSASGQSSDTSRKRFVSDDTIIFLNSGMDAFVSRRNPARFVPPSP